MMRSVVTLEWPLSKSEILLDYHTSYIGQEFMDKLISSGNQTSKERVQFSVLEFDWIFKGEEAH